MPWVGGVHYLLELGSHFVPFYAAGAWASFAILIALDDKRVAVVAACALVLSGAAIISCYIPREASQNRGAPIRVMVSNVLTSNKNFDEFIELVRKESPDVLALLEINEKWVQALGELDETYPYKLLYPQSDNFGIGILSRGPMRDVEKIDLLGVPALHARLALSNRMIDLLVVHTLPPVSAANAAVRNRQLEMIAEIGKYSDGLQIVVGDLNTTMWSPHFRALLKASGLKDARKGFGVQPTWPAELSPFMIPIDQCLYQNPLAVKNVRKTQSFGSDHLSLVVDFIPPGRRTERERRRRGSASDGPLPATQFLKNGLARVESLE
jgi:endonuclease/exonuclease/phosphatase (EEP) superfamily protein YafD